MIIKLLKKTHLRRPLTALLVIMGAMMMFLAPETWAGAMLLVLGIIIEVIGIALRHQNQPPGSPR